MRRSRDDKSYVINLTEITMSFDESNNRSKTDDNIIRQSYFLLNALYSIYIIIRHHIHS